MRSWPALWAVALILGFGGCTVEGVDLKQITDPDGWASPTAEAGTVVSGDAGADVTVDAGPPPLPSKYTRAGLYYTTEHQAGLSCAFLCGTQKAQCANATSKKTGDYAVCYGESKYTIPRAWYTYGKNNSSKELKCDQDAEAQKKGGLWGTTMYDFEMLECCCLLRETQWLANDAAAPRSCNEICQARGLECGTHDRCRDIPSMCSKAFPKFNVQSIATYGPDAKGVGKVTYPTCSTVPAKERLQSHSCVCL